MPLEVNYQLITIGLSVLGAAVWCGSIYAKIGILINDVQELKESVKDNSLIKQRIFTLEKDYVELHKAVYKSGANTAN
jgi:uncharacterized protein (UPF0264 family)